jgi:hypothetical protein
MEYINALRCVRMCYVPQSFEGPRHDMLLVDRKIIRFESHQAEVPLAVPVVLPFHAVQLKHCTVL